MNVTMPDEDWIYNRCILKCLTTRNSIDAINALIAAAVTMIKQMDLDRASL